MIYKGELMKNAIIDIEKTANDGSMRGKILPARHAKSTHPSIEDIPSREVLRNNLDWATA